MKFLIMPSILLFLFPSSAIAQVTAQKNQQGDDCVINIMGNGNTASLKCDNLDPKLAGQIQEILNSSKRNERTSKNISEKLDMILKEVKRPIPRRIPAEKRAGIIELLTRNPATIAVQVIQGNAEAYQLAQDWYDVLKAAGWTMRQDTVEVFMSVGKPITGLLLRVYGETPKTTPLQIQVPENSPLGVLANTLNQLDLKQQTLVAPSPDHSNKLIVFQIHEQPKI